jgi:hypothetical protein
MDKTSLDDMRTLTKAMLPTPKPRRFRCPGRKLIANHGQVRPDDTEYNIVISR